MYVEWGEWLAAGAGGLVRLGLIPRPPPPLLEDLVDPGGPPAPNGRQGDAGSVPGGHARAGGSSHQGPQKAGRHVCDRQEYRVEDGIRGHFPVQEAAFERRGGAALNPRTARRGRAAERSKAAVRTPATAVPSPRG